MINIHSSTLPWISKTSRIRIQGLQTKVNHSGEIPKEADYNGTFFGLHHREEGVTGFS